jgi:hypothetical protein
VIVPCGHPFGWEAPVISTLAGASSFFGLWLESVVLISRHVVLLEQQ